MDMLSNLWKRQAPQMVGIDIGSHEVKAILLSKTADGYKILSHAAVPIKKGPLTIMIFVMLMPLLNALSK